MPKFESEGAFGGATSGAAVGAGIGAGFGPWGAAGGALGGLLLGGGLGGFFGGSKRKSIDISAEIAKIKALYAENKQAAIAAINQEAARGRSATASNLAARGIYRSPVSEGTFNLLEDARLAAIGQASGRIAGEQAGVQAQLLQMLTGQGIQDQQLREQQRAALYGALAGLGGSLLAGGARKVQAPVPGQPRPSAALGQNAYSAPGGFVSPTAWPGAYSPQPGGYNNALLLRALGGR